MNYIQRVWLKERLVEKKFELKNKKWPLGRGRGKKRKTKKIGRKRGINCFANNYTAFKDHLQKKSTVVNTVWSLQSATYIFFFKKKENGFSWNVYFGPIWQRGNSYTTNRHWYLFTHSCLGAKIYRHDQL